MGTRARETPSSDGYALVVLPSVAISSKCLGNPSIESQTISPKNTQQIHTIGTFQK